MVAAVAAASALKRMQNDTALRREMESKAEVAEKAKLEAAEADANSQYKDASQYSHPWAKRYIGVAKRCDNLVRADWFNLFIIFVIVLAGILVGMQTYEAFDPNPYIDTVDLMILAIFGAEVGLKILAEAMAPWRFFTGPERAWNNFDLVIVVLSLPMWGSTFGGSNSVKLLRLTRLMRVMKLVKKIPQLQMIVMGLIGGLRSIVYILALLTLVFYLYAIIGFYMFHENDEFHFGSVPVSIVTLFRMATLEDWTDVVYTQYFGCDSEMFDSREQLSGYFGACPAGSASLQEPLRGLTIIYFVSFIVVSALVMLSLFVGAVTMSMTESMATMKMEAEMAERRRRKEKAKKRAEREERQKNRRQGMAKIAPINLAALKGAAGVVACAGPGEGGEGGEGEEGEEGAEAAPKSLLSRGGGVGGGVGGGGSSPTAPGAEAGQAGAAKKKTATWAAGLKAAAADFSNQEASMAMSVLSKFAEPSGNALVHPLGMETGAGYGGPGGTRRFKLLASKAVQSIKERHGSVVWNPFAAGAGSKEETQRVRAAFKAAWEGTDLLESLGEDGDREFHSGFKMRYAKLAGVCRRVVDNAGFSNFIIFTIVVASLLEGFQTESFMNEGVPGQVAKALDWVIVGIFLAEIVLKTIAEGFKPWRYFASYGKVQGWNVFDYTVIIGSLLPGSNSMITVLRLLRLLRVLKLVKSLRELQVIIVALIGGLSSISYIGVILFLVFYVFAIMGMILFQESDPWHFGSLHTSLLTLFRIATLDDWTDIMYINMYGCDKYGYLGIESLCVQPSALGFVAVVYFIIFVLIGALVLMTLFIGVVTTSMEEATTSQKEQQEFNEKLEAIKVKYSISDKAMRAYEVVFKMLDLDGSESVEEEELRFGLNSIGKCPSDEQLSRMMGIVDVDGSGELSFDEVVILFQMIQHPSSRMRTSPPETPLSPASAKKEMDRPRGGSALFDEGFANRPSIVAKFGSVIFDDVPRSESQIMQLQNAAEARRARS